MSGPEEYQNATVAERYESHRFSGSGGNYVNQVEHSVLRSMLPKVEAAHILDLACGTGRMMPILDHGDSHVVGLDLSWPMLKEAQRTFPSQYIQGDLYQLPFKESSFDIVTAYRVHYLLHDTESFFMEIRRVLDDDGVMIFTTVSKFSSRGFLNLAQKLLTKNKGIRPAAPGALTASLAKSGFRVERLVRKFSLPLNSYRLLPSSVLRVAEFVDDYLPSSVRVGIFVKCKKNESEPDVRLHGSVLS